MTDVIRHLKDKFSWQHVSSYSWIPTKRMLADFMKKQMKIGGEVWDVFQNGVWEDGKTCHNIVQKKGLEFTISNKTDSPDIQDD